MSAIYFNFQNGHQVRIEGRERAHLGLLLPNLANAIIGATRIVITESTPQPYTYFEEARASELLDVCMALESDAISLACRIHGQCELHGWVDGPNRAWLAGLIGEGRRAGILRPDMGWETLTTVLRAGDQTPAVMSYSVTDNFPSMRAAGWKEKRRAEWDELTRDQAWDVAMQGLRAEAQNGWSLELRPQDWRGYRFQDEK